MGRRQHSDEIAFGSDSFLDIVANIVGILIILIVIAGLRVSKLPTIRESTESAEPPAIAAVSIPPEVESLQQPEPVTPPEPPPELVERVQQVRAEIDRLTQTRQDLATRLQAESASTEKIRQQVPELQAVLQNKQATTEQGRQVIAALQTDLETTQRAIAGLHLELSETENAEPPPQELRHKVTPIGRRVVGEELWFVLDGNRVAVLPAKELTDQAIRDIKESRTRLLRGLTFHRTYGPIDGFLLKVEARSVSLSQLESWRYSGRRDDLQLSIIGEVEQTSEVEFESLSEALQNGSKFIKACRSAGRDATLTFFVYPDSFDIYGRLKEFGYDNGFDVAANPRPQGHQIKWNPITGQQSVAQ